MAPGVDDLLGVAIGVALLLFLVAVGAFVYAFGVGLARSTRGDNVAVANLFFLQGSAPKPIKRKFLWLFLVCLAITVGTAAWEPFGVLVPMLPVGLAGMWAARYGVFPPRPVAQPRRRGLMADAAHEQIHVDASPARCFAVASRVRGVSRVDE